MVIIPIHKILSIHNGMDPNDSNLKLLAAAFPIWLETQGYIVVSTVFVYNKCWKITVH
jgi:hypothetical protein